MFVRLWLYQKSLQVHSSWFEQAKKIDAGPKPIQQIEFVGKLDNVESINTDVAESMFILTIFKKSKKQDWNFFKEV